MLSQGEFAKIAGVSQQGISKAVKAGKITFVGGKVDTEGAETIEYLRQRSEVKAGHRQEPNRRPAPRPVQQNPEPEETDSNMPAPPPRGSKAYFDLALMRERVLSARMKNALQVGELILRDTFERGIWSPINACWVQMLSDVPKSLSVQVASAVKAGAEVVEIEGMIRKAMSSAINAARTKCADTLERIK